MLFVVFVCFLGDRRCCWQDDWVTDDNGLSPAVVTDRWSGVIGVLQTEEDSGWSPNSTAAVKDFDNNYEQIIRPSQSTRLKKPKNWMEETMSSSDNNTSNSNGGTEEQQSNSNVKSVRMVLLGGGGVGKSSLTEQFINSYVFAISNWTTRKQRIVFHHLPALPLRRENLNDNVGN